MFDYREFLMKGFKNAIGKMPDYKIILNASGHYEKGVLEETDLSELQKLIDIKNSFESESIDVDLDVNESYEAEDNGGEV